MVETLGLLVFGEGRAIPEAENRLGLTDWADEALLRLEHWRHRRAVITACAGLALIALGAGWAYGKTRDEPSVESRIPQAGAVSVQSTPSTPATPSTPSTPSTAGGATGDAQQQRGEPDNADAVAEEHVVHVVGEVNKPGLVVVSTDARVNDVLTAAGGPTPEADLQRLNLASPVVDGMQVRVPAVGVEDAGPLLSHPAATALPGTTLPSGPVNLNTAPTDVLETLPGVGPATAAAIVTWREANGGFQSTDELLDVPGIGPAKLAVVRDLVEI